VWTHKGREEYARVYIYGEGETNPAMELGQKVANMVYDDKEQDDPILEHLRIYLPKYEHREFEIPRLSGDKRRCQCEKCVARGIEKPLYFNGVPLYGVLDGWTDKGWRAHECKTARSRAYEKLWREQIAFYSLLLLTKFSVAPHRINWLLSWMPTEWLPGSTVQPTGEIENIEVKVDPTELLRIGAKIPKVWAEIGRFTAKEYKSLGL
jgi:hypothetical protein